KRHPRWLEFEIAAIAARYDPVGLHGQGAPADEYRPAARMVAQRLRELDPAAATRADVSRITYDTFAGLYAGRQVGEETTYRAMAAIARVARIAGVAADGVGGGDLVPAALHDVGAAFGKEAALASHAGLFRRLLGDRHALGPAHVWIGRGQRCQEQLGVGVRRM